MSDFSYSETIRRLSPNHGPRKGRGAAAPDMIVLHYTAMANASAAIARLCDPGTEVSAHYLIDEEGRVFGLVPEERRAWHAGVGHWGGDSDVNSRSIGVELSHPGETDGAAQPAYAAAQMAALEALLRTVFTRWSIVPKRVVGHSDVAPGRKFDPGPAFDWRRLAAADLAIAPSEHYAYRNPAPSADAPAFDAAARRFGYGDWPGPVLREAFRRRFHQWTGVRPNASPAAPMAMPEALREGELAMIRDLARIWPA